MTSPNRVYREDLGEHSECRDCETPLLETERNYSRCGVCRVKRKLKAAQKGGADQGRLADLRRQYHAARDVCIRIIRWDDGAGDREAIRRRRAA